MPSSVLTSNQVVLCVHGGTAKPTAPNPRVRVMGVPVVTQAAPFVVLGCANPPPPANVGACAIANWFTASSRVRVMGRPVLLQDSQALCVPTGTPLTIALTPHRVRAI